ncbi:MAG TPA: hypothetical protein VF230_06030 [Acidimicrobiales bacterium]
MSEVFREASLTARSLAADVRATDADARDLGLRRGVTRWGFPVLIAGLIAASVAASTVRVDERASGESVVSSADAAVGFLPVAVADDLRAGQPVRVEVGEETVDGRVARVRPPLSARDLERLIRADVGQLADAGAVAVVELALDRPVATRASGEVLHSFDIRLERRSLAQLILPRLRSTFGIRSDA